MTWLRPYYLATPAFVLFDLLWGFNVRAVALEHAPAWKYAYYAFCLGCGVVIAVRPGWSALVGFVESSVNVLLLVLAVVLPYLAALRALSEGQAITNPFTPRFLVNFVLSATMGTIAFYETLPNRRPFP